MALPQTVINLFPHVSASLEAVTQAAALGGGVATGLGLMRWARAALRRSGIRVEARHQGLSEGSVAFLERILAREREGVTTARELLRCPELLEQRLASEVGRCRRLEAARRVASSAGHLVNEVRHTEPVADEHPQVFEMVTLRDAADPEGPAIPAWVVAIDEARLVVVSTQDCPWPVRHDVLVTRREAGGQAFLTSLLLKPVPGCREFVLSHELDGQTIDPRANGRTPCRIAAWTLPTTPGTYALRGRLQAGEPIDPESLRRLPAWPRRHAVTIEDISVDGARLTAEHHVERGARFYLVLAQLDGDVVAMPLSEVVSVRRGEDGILTLGVRFCAVRSTERECLADYCREAGRRELAPT